MFILTDELGKDSMKLKSIKDTGCDM